MWSWQMRNSRNYERVEHGLTSPSHYLPHGNAFSQQCPFVDESRGKHTGDGSRVVQEKVHRATNSPPLSV